MKDRLDYSESSFIVNAMEYYLANFKAQLEGFTKEDMDYYSSIIDKYRKLEGQILNLRIKEEK